MPQHQKTLVARIKRFTWGERGKFVICVIYLFSSKFAHNLVLIPSLPWAYSRYVHTLKGPICESMYHGGITVKDVKKKCENCFEYWKEDIFNQFQQLRKMAEKIDKSKTADTPRFEDVFRGLVRRSSQHHRLFRKTEFRKLLSFNVTMRCYCLTRVNEVTSLKRSARLRTFKGETLLSGWTLWQLWISAENADDQSSHVVVRNGLFSASWAVFLSFGT